MSRALHWTKSILIYAIGLFLCAMGVSLSVLSGLGVSPVSSFPYVISLLIDVDLGTCITIVYCVFILLQFVLLGKKLHIVNLLQIVCSWVFGLFVNATTALVALLGQPNSYIISLLLLLSSIVLIGLGVTLYMRAGVMLLPAEGLMKAFAIVAKLKTSTAKVIFDVSLVTMSIVLSFVFFGTLEGVREGTIITALCVGLVMKLFGHILDKPLTALLGNNGVPTTTDTNTDTNTDTTDQDDSCCQNTDNQ